MTETLNKMIDRINWAVVLPRLLMWVAAPLPLYIWAYFAIVGV